MVQGFSFKHIAGQVGLHASEKCSCHGFPMVFHRFSTVFPPARIEIRSINQGASGFLVCRHG
jgi:hypothetical protein